MSIARMDPAVPFRIERGCQRLELKFMLAIDTTSKVPAVPGGGVDEDLIERTKGTSPILHTLSRSVCSPPRSLSYTAL